MISILEEELITKKNWITSADMLDMLVIAESTPGVIAVNTATSVGYRLRGVLGALIATLGVVLPSFVIITGLSFVIEAVADNLWYKAAFTGIQACVIILIVNAFTKMAKQLTRDWFNVVLVIAAFSVAAFTNFNVIFLIIIGGVLGVCYSLISEAVIKKRQKSAQTDGADADVIASVDEQAEGAANDEADKTADDVSDEAVLEPSENDGQNGGE